MSAEYTVYLTYGKDNHLESYQIEESAYVALTKAITAGTNTFTAIKTYELELDRTVDITTSNSLSSYRREISRQRRLYVT